MPNTAIRKLSSAGLSGEFGVESGLRVARCQVSLPSVVKTAGPWLLQKMMVVPGRAATLPPGCCRHLRDPARCRRYVVSAQTYFDQSDLVGVANPAPQLCVFFFARRLASGGRPIFKTPALTITNLASYRLNSSTTVCSVVELSSPLHNRT